MTTAAYTGYTITEYRAACPIHSIKSEVQPNENAAAMLAADTRAFCPVCQDEAGEVGGGMGDGIDNTRPPGERP